MIYKISSQAGNTEKVLVQYQVINQMINKEICQVRKMELLVKIISYEKPLDANFELYDEDEYILEEKYKGNSVDAILNKVNAKYNITKQHNIDRFTDGNLIYVTYAGVSNGLKVIVEIDDEM